MGNQQVFQCLGWPLREQARSHIGFPLVAYFVDDTDHLWERACSRRGHSRPTEILRYRATYATDTPWH
jgi:hypothetical protein